jgi:hypothetical protein
MEEMLNVFQTDLGNISREIKNLQERSTEINIKLKNRKVGIGWIETCSRVCSMVAKNYCYSGCGRKTWAHFG